MENTNNLFKGFNENEIVNLYKFLCAYEKIESYKNDNNLKNDYPQFSNVLFGLLDKIELRPKNGVTMIYEMNQVHYTDAGRNKNLAFMYHVRNAIAHGYIEKNDSVFIKDLHHRTLTASGNIEYTIFNDIIILTISELIN